MMSNKLIFSVVLLIGSFGVFYYFINPIYAGITIKKETQAKYQEALKNADQIQERINTLQKAYDSYTEEQRNWVKKMLPDQFDEMEFVYELNQIAKKSGMLVEKISLKGKEGYGPEKDLGAIATQKLKETSLPGIQEVGATFFLKGTYEELTDFLGRLETNLRVLDVNEINIATETSSENESLYQYKIMLDTYWIDY